MSEEVSFHVHVDVLGREHRFEASDVLQRFLARISALARDPAVKFRELEDVLFGGENPLLDHVSRPGRHLVTREALLHPAFLVFHEVLEAKRFAQGGRKPEGDFVRLIDASELCGAAVSTIRKALQEGRLRGYKKGSSWRVHVEDLPLLKPRARDDVGSEEDG